MTAAPMLCIVSEFVELGSLETHIADENFTFSVKKFLKIVNGAIAGMIHLHQMGIGMYKKKPGVLVLLVVVGVQKQYHWTDICQNDHKHHAVHRDLASRNVRIQKIKRHSLKPLCLNVR